ncbi:uncharacterized protein N7500_009667 [Penicillium coprophilum]|uniref:uncharacterized protein n=1 Tax=Penicillium coprophilum TaxID=36646 RepID=UPI0023A07062|nr:uncharacterized protein N7500_009667 [Penicillium coprophilum]KAJ5154228.1 hypothetical protein N7500_009667 [Penicillium coprophilum]
MRLLNLPTLFTQTQLKLFHFTTLKRTFKIMAPLNPTSQEAINRLRNYVPPPTTYSLVPLSRRAAVLILLFADAKGDLKVVVTIRAKTLSSYAGDAALPGGRADNTETAFQTARREASEEIGLPDINQKFPPPFSVEHLCELPANLARTEVVVRPCVALLHGSDLHLGLNADPEASLVPILDAREVEAVFTAPLKDFLSQNISVQDDWYTGTWGTWHNSQWRMHQFFVRHEDQVYRIFGMTARIIVDAARVAYAQEPEFEHNSHFGDEEMITRLFESGQLSEEKAKLT